MEIDAGTQVALSLMACGLAIAGIMGTALSAPGGMALVFWAGLVTWIAIDVGSLEYVFLAIGDVLVFLAPVFMAIAVLLCIAGVVMPIALRFARKDAGGDEAAKK